MRRCVTCINEQSEEWQEHGGTRESAPSSIREETQRKTTAGTLTIFMFRDATEPWEGKGSVPNSIFIV